MIKMGQQYTFSMPLFPGVSVAVCMGELEGEYDFLHYIDGKFFEGSSLHLSEEQIQQGTFDIKPIDETHPAYIKDWASNPMVGLFKSLKKAEEVKKAGGSDDEFFGALMMGMMEEMGSAMTGKPTVVPAATAKPTTRRKRK